MCLSFFATRITELSFTALNRENALGTGLCPNTTLSATLCDWWLQQTCLLTTLICEKALV